MNKTKLLILFLLIFSISKAEITISTNTGDNCSSLSVSFTFTPNVVKIGFDFNTNTLPTGWDSSPYKANRNFCITQSKSNSPYFWATTTNSNKIRFVSTNEINVSSGGIIQFDMRYGSRDRKFFPYIKDYLPWTGCEDPDLPDEGVFLQFTLDGSSWTTIDWWKPERTIRVSSNGINLYQWNTFTCLIPDIAKSPKTKFRWYQPSNSGDDYDNWGLDDIKINIFKPAISQEWDFGDGTTSTEKEPNHTFPRAGTYTITLKVIDSDNKVHIKSFIHTVTENSKPTIDPITDIEVLEDCGLISIDITNISDGDICIEQKLSFKISSSNSKIVPTPTITYIQNEETGILSFTPNPDMNGYTDITLTVTDEVSQSGGKAKSKTVTFRIRVKPINDLPIGNDNFVYIVKNSRYMILPSDITYSDVENDILIAVIITSLPKKGTLKLNGIPIKLNDTCALKNYITFTPLPNEVGTPYANVSYKIIDEEGGISIKENTLTFNVLDKMSDVPLANNDKYFIYINHSLDDKIQGKVTQNDTDRGTGTRISIKNHTNTKNGSLVINKDGTFTYKPNLDFCGIDSAQYRITNGITTSNTATIKIVVDTARWNGYANFSSISKWNAPYLPLSTDDIKVETGFMILNSEREVKSLYLSNGASIEINSTYKFTINGFLNNSGGDLKAPNKAQIIIKGSLLKNNVIKSKNSSTIIIRSEIKY